MKRIFLFLMLCVALFAFVPCVRAEPEDESEDAITASHTQTMKELVLLRERAKTLTVRPVPLSSTGVQVTDYTETGNGDSESTPYLIKSVSDLKLLSERVNNGTEPSGKYYRLDSDIDLSSETDWEEIGFLSSPFTGHFDGNNKTITVNHSGTIIVAGVFLSVKSSGIAIKNLTVKGTVTSLSTTVSGSLTGASASGIVYELESGTLENCSFEGTVEARSSASNSIGSAAGIVGIVNSGVVVENCSFNGTVRATGGYSALGATAGGIAYMQYGTVSTCTTSSSSTVHASGGPSYAGGITGFAMTGRVNITNCRSDATISGATYKGGILGSGTSSTVLSGNSYTGASQEVGNSGANSGGGGNGGAVSSSSSGGGGGCNSGLGALALSLCALLVVKRDRR